MDGWATKRLAKLLLDADWNPSLAGLIPQSLPDKLKNLAGDSFIRPLAPKTSWRPLFRLEPSEPNLGPLKISETSSEANQCLANAHHRIAGVPEA